MWKLPEYKEPVSKSKSGPKKKGSQKAEVEEDKPSEAPSQPEAVLQINHKEKVNYISTTSTGTTFVADPTEDITAYQFNT